MKNIFSYLSKNIVSTILVTILTGLTVTTSAAGTAKLLSSMNSFKPSVPEVKDVQAVENSSEKSKDPSPTAKTGEIKSLKNTSSTITPTPKQGSNNTVQNANTCIITLFGKQYDVFSLMSTHSGGNVFTCNTDMTSVYQNRHGTDVSRMQKYLVTSTTGTKGITAGTTNSNGRIDDDDREDVGESDDDIRQNVQNREIEHNSTDNQSK